MQRNASAARPAQSQDTLSHYLGDLRATPLLTRGEEVQLAQEIEEVAESASGGNFKSLLQQVAQREFNATPQYVLLDEKGPDHSKCFKIAALIGRHTYAGAWGRTKKEAEQKAAMNALSAINNEEIPFAAD